ncbi:hypothetical protein [Neisseria gonorrhoeae]|uniref:hypothetical protein n=1 Tax=Neisseria gonorrhoeae TaxID=485 RepID=UPI0021D79836|nr:hypothetical protein [Neisseria gonorrhoeae]UXY70289.1 hypothetical protein OCL40_04125 [Neisseria gonorrhoeae]
MNPPGGIHYCNGRYVTVIGTEPKLTKADESACGIHYCNGALQSSGTEPKLTKADESAWRHPLL